jgi:hypothetical protein
MLRENRFREKKMLKLHELSINAMILKVAVHWLYKQEKVGWRARTRTRTRVKSDG